MSASARMRVRVPALPTKSFPKAAYISRSDSIQKLNEFLDRGQGKTVVITGAGISVDSGIRAYRGPEGSYTRAGKEHRPIFYHEFIEGETFRRRYWARSYLGYVPVREASPNPTHYAMAALSTMGIIDKTITQNVDGLTHKALDDSFATYLHSPIALMPSKSSLNIPTALTPPSKRILEIHGTLRHVECLSCKDVIGRDQFQDRLSELNPAWIDYLNKLDQGKAGKQVFNPDGDIDLGPGVAYEDFVVPPCTKCGSELMKPKVTFFGESLGPAVRDLSLEWVAKASNLLIMGSSLATFSAFRLIAAYRAGQVSRGNGRGEVGMINIGESRGDPAVDWRIDRSAGEILPETASLQFKGLDSQTDWEVKDATQALLGRGVVKKVREGSATA